MQIMIICLNAMTSSVLAKKLNTYAKANGYQDEFRAVRLALFDYYLKETSLILLAPQAESFCRMIEQKVKGDEIPVLVLSEHEFVYSDVKMIYKKVDSYKLVKHTSLKSVKSYDEFTVALFIKNFISMMLVPTVFCIISFLLYVVFRIEFVESLFYSLSKMFGLYFLITIGCSFARTTKENQVYYALMTMLCYFTILYDGAIQHYSANFLEYSTGYMDLSLFSCRFYPIIFAIGMLTCLLINCMERIIRRYLPFMYNSDSFYMLHYLISIGPVFFIFFIVRIILDNFL